MASEDLEAVVSKVLDVVEGLKPLRLQRRPTKLTWRVYAIKKVYRYLGSFKRPIVA
jgi:hypothetical protein